MQLDHGIKLQTAGTTSRALAALGEWHSARIVASHPTVHVFAFYYEENQAWRTGVEFQLHDIAADGRVRRAASSSVPVCDETDQTGVVRVSDGFTLEDAQLLSVLRQELVAARDSGDLPNLETGLASIYPHPRA